MVQTGHLGGRELFALSVIVSLANVFLSYPQQMVRYGSAAGWMIPLISTVFCCGVWWAMSRVLARYPGENLLTVTERRFGRGGLAVLAGVLAVYFLLDAASTMRLFTETVVTTVLPRSPISFIAIPFVLASVYYAYVGIEGQTRVTWLLAPGMVIGLGALLLLNSNWTNKDYMFPLWGNGFPELLVGGGLVTGVFLNVTMLAVLGTLLREHRKLKAVGFLSIGMVGLLYAAVTLVLTLVFPPESSMRVPFPLYQLGRMIYIGQFLQRLEAAFVFIWVAMAVIKIGFHLWFAAYLLAEAAKMPVYRPLMFALGLLIYSLSFIPGSFPEMLELNTNYLLGWGWTVVIALPLLVTLFAAVKRGKGEEDDAYSGKAS